MTPLTRTALGATLALSAVASLATEGSGTQVTRRLCDRQLTYEIMPPVDVAPNLARLSGVWRGTIKFAGGSEMCVAMAVKEVFPDGRVILAMAWNVSLGGREDINNFVGMGVAPDWPNKVENGDLRIDSGTRWNGTHYYYVMKLPTAAKPNVMEGRWMADRHAQPVVLYRDNGGWR
jgi:hypothetical protein